MRRGTVPNSFLKNTEHLLVPFVRLLFTATQHLDYCPPDWALTKTLALKKPGKPNYSSLSVWWLIFLSNRLACLLNACITGMVVTICEKLHLLPDHHFRARPGCTITDSVHLLVKTVKDSWRKNQVSSALFLDVKSAFPSIDINGLIHNMRKLGFLVEFTNWFLRWLTGRQTSLFFDDYQTLAFVVGNGLDQGDLFSGITYLIYNADLPKIADIKLSKWILLFVDDAAVIVTGKYLTETHKKLHNIMDRVLKWANTHNCKFGIEKFQLLNFTKKTTPHPFIRKKRIPTLQMALKLGNHHIPSKDTAKFLRVILDNKLNWKSHEAAALAKGQDWLFKLGCLSKTYKGTHANWIRQIYLAVAVPRMLYAADIFLTP